MPGLGLLLDVISFSAAISACVKVHQWQCVAPLLDGMCEEGLPYTVISFNAAISACVKDGQSQ
eukprot:3043117-Karenia_brevis.AAC.1